MIVLRENHDKRWIEEVPGFLTDPPDQPKKRRFEWKWQDPFGEGKT